MSTTLIESSLHENALKTVAVNGAYTASRALSKWFKKGVRVMTEGFERVPIHQLADAAGAADEVVVAIHTGITGDLRGHVLLTMSEPVAAALASLLTGEPAGLSMAGDDLAKSSLQETANIVASSFVSSLATWLKVAAEPTPPELICDLSCAVIQPALLDQAHLADDALLARTQFLMDGLHLEWKLFVFPSPDSIRLIDALSDTRAVERNAPRTVAVNGAFNASRALSKWFRKGVHITTDGFVKVPINDLASVTGEPDRILVGMHMGMVGDLTGHILLAFPEATGKSLVDVLLEQPAGTTTEFGELERSCLQETANIVGSAFTNSLAMWLDLSTEPTSPVFIHDMACSLFEPLLIEHAMEGDDALLARTDFSMDRLWLDWEFYILPSPAAMRVIEEHLVG